MENQLTKGSIARMFDGILELDPILQILSVGLIQDNPRESTRLLISDGEWATCFAALDTSLNCMVISGYISQNCIIIIKEYAFNKNTNIVFIMDLTVLQSGATVGQRIGNPQSFKMKKDETANSIQDTKPEYKSPVQLTKGAILTFFDIVTPEEPEIHIYNFGDTEGPVLQVLNITCSHVEPKHYRIVLSDGLWSNSFCWLNIQLNDKFKSGAISKNCIIRINKCHVQPHNFNMKHMSIEELVVVESGANIGQVIGDPQPMANELTRGILGNIFRNAEHDVSPILQVLLICHSKLHYSFVVSDGQFMSKLAILAPSLDFKVEAGEISNKCIILLNNCRVHLDKNLKFRALEILDITVLQSGADVLDQKIGDPVDYTCKSWPSQMVNTFEKRGIYVNEAVPGIDKHIWHN